MSTEAPLKAATGISLAVLNKLLGEAQAANVIPRRDFKPPELPPGVVPKGVTAAVACDSAVELNNWMNTQQGFCGLGFPGYSYLSELSQRSEYRAPSQVIAQEMTREWIEIRGAPEAKLKEMTDCMDDMNIRGSFEQLATIDGLFGRSQLAINIKGQDTDKRRRLPLVIDAEGRGMAKGSLVGLKPVEPIWSTPNTYNSIDPTRDDFYAPQWWYVVGKQTHESRLLTFISHPMPDILKPAYNFSGLSLSQLVEPYVIRWLKTVDSVNRLISMYSTSGILTNMQATLAGDDEGAGGSIDVFKRMQLFASMRDNRGMLMLDKASEEFFQFNTPLAGLADLQAQAQEHMAAPTHIPLVKLTGVTPAGLNASSDGEIKVFYDYVSAMQKSFFNRHLRTVLRIIQLHLWGKIDPNITHEWVALDSPTDKEEAEMRKADGDRDAAYVTNGIVDADEVRERLRTDKRSGYAFVKGPAPPSPLEQEADVTEEGKQADHERGEESAEAAHGRAKELEKFKLAKDSWNESDHPRAAGGQFGSGGAPAAGKSKAPFVNEFMKGSTNREADMARLSSMSDEKLKAALELLTKHRLTDEDSVYMKELIRDVLKSSQ